nr:MAG TPA: Thymidylate synthase complementing protein [Crassvirales sp.]
MKIIHPSVEYWSQANTLDGIWKHAVRCARVCYQSAHTKEDESAKDFLLRTIAKNGFKKDKSSHMSVLEHATVYIKVTNKEGGYYDLKDKYLRNSYSKVMIDVYTSNPIDSGIPYAEALITTNLRVIIENEWHDDLQYICKPTQHHIKRYTFSFITNLGVSRELNRHRCHSISEESTRYCNYSKDKFGNGLTFIIPEWLDLEECNIDDTDKDFIHLPNQYRFDGTLANLVDGDKNLTVEGEWLANNVRAQIHYLNLLKKGWKPQQAREVLPLSLKTQVVHTAFEDDWKDFIALRSDGISGAPHPNIKVLADKVKELIEQM